MLYCIDRMSYYRVHSVVDLSPQLQTLAEQGLSRTRKKELFNGLDLAIAARVVWMSAGPQYPEESWHYKVADASGLIHVVPRLQKSRFKLTDAEVATLTRRLEEMGNSTLSFSRFCALLREDVLAKRPEDISTRSPRMGKQQKRLSLAEVFLTEDEEEHLMREPSFR